MGDSPAGPQGRVSLPRRIEETLAYLVIGAIAFLPTAEVLVRNVLRTGIPGSGDLLRHLVLWAAFLGGMITSREERHIALTAGFGIIPKPAQVWVKAATSAVAVAVSTAFTFASLTFVVIGLEGMPQIVGIPIQLFGVIMPVGFLVITVRFLIKAGTAPAHRLVAAAGLLPGLLISWVPLLSTLELLAPGVAGALYGGPTDAVLSVTAALHLPLVLVIIASSLLGAPIFVLLGGLGYLFILNAGGAPAVMSDEAYNMISGPYIGAIPLFTLVGFFLSAGKAGERLVRFFRAVFGWLPGGLAAVSIVLCTFFASFTGASGVTILALGSILAYILIENGYHRDFAHGLQTVSGIGTLFPPSLPVIMYGVIAQINVGHMFIAGLLPGTLMVVVMWLYGGTYAIRRKIPRIPFVPKEAAAAFRGALAEILLPVIILVLFFGGIATLVETGAIAVVYVLLVGIIVHRDLGIREIRSALLKAVPVMGGVLLILASAKGLSYYVVDAQVPDRLTEWLSLYVRSRYVFLLLLNLALIVVGCFMDIYSAIAVVVPLLLPLGVAYGIDPIHLGIIFLANLELGYLTPPVGLNLFLASYLFGKPLTQIYRNVLAPLLMLLVSVLLITYVPWLSMALVRAFGG
jgi:tripartite ATP-independent transporter DctM subunit